MTSRSSRGNRRAERRRLEAFFTWKGKDVFAILPRWPGGSLHLKELTGVKAVSLLGGGKLKFKAEKGGVTVDLGTLPEELLAQPMWTLRVSPSSGQAGERRTT